MIDEELVTRFDDAGAAVLAGMRELTPEQLDLPGADGGWSPRFVIHHLVDAEIVNARRLRRLLSEPSAHLSSFDPMALAAGTHYERPVAPSIALFEAIHAANLDLVRSLDADAWTIECTHEELGTYTVSVWLERRIAHDHGHLEQIRAAVPEVVAES